MPSFVNMGTRRIELSVDGETKCSYMKYDREDEEEKTGQHGGEGEQCAAMVTNEPLPMPLSA